VCTRRFAGAIDSREKKLTKKQIRNGSELGATRGIFYLGCVGGRGESVDIARKKSVDMREFLRVGSKSARICEAKLIRNFRNYLSIPADIFACTLSRLERIPRSIPARLDQWASNGGTPCSAQYPVQRLPPF
jgi:hypothetical protein